MKTLPLITITENGYEFEIDHAEMNGEILTDEQALELAEVETTEDLLNL